MKTEISKMIVLPVDGSKNALQSLDYIKLLYESDHRLTVSLLYILPALPPILVEESKKNRQTAAQLKKNRSRYYDVRHRSLAISAQQINIMYEQIKINHALISHDPSERYIIEKEKYTIQTTLDLFNQSIGLISSLKAQSGK